MSSNRKLGYSGALATSDATLLAGLAQGGDRLTKLTLTFSYGSTEPDVGLSVSTASDYRETQTVYHYVSCPEAGPIDTPSANSDANKDSGPQVDLASIGQDATPKPDALSQPPADASARLDGGAPTIADAGLAEDTSRPPTPSDAGAKGAAAIDGSRTWGSGCSLLGASTSGKWLALALLGFVFGTRVRRRRTR